MKINNIIIAASVVLASASANIGASAQSPAGKLYYDRVFAPSEGYVGKIEKSVRKEICLNGYWDFQAVTLPSDYKQGKGTPPELPLPVDNKWDATKIKIPSPWNINSFANRNSEGPDHRNYPSYPKAWDDVKMAWMRKTVVVPADWRGNRLLLHFEAVAGQTQVYVNGVKAAENFDLFLPFDADITQHVKAGETAEVWVGVRSQALFEDNSTKGRRIVPAGSMWGYHINGIWQDVYLLAVPEISVSNVFIKPLISKKTLEIDVAIANATGKNAELTLNGDIREWINKAGATIHAAPEPNWELAALPALSLSAQKLKLPVGVTTVTVSIPVPDGALEYWTPEFPNLYGLTLTLASKTSVTDIKYERFGWREWTIDGTKHLLNGKVYPLKGDSWHFMGVPQMTRRYAYAWFTALKDANANAVRPHAQIYPRFYFDVADEMGICILAETANWASDGGPKLDAPQFWENSKEHLKRMVVRDRNHPSVFGWSVSNENKPVILSVFNKPEWMEQQKQAWKDWTEIVRANDPTRPWISSDGEEDGEGLLPTTVGHYGDDNSLKSWAAIGKPWGVGETGMAYYGTPEQVAKFNGERAYASMEGRMEGLAYESYRLISRQREAGASYSSVFNLAWYALQPLPFGKRDLTAPPDLDDGVHFGEYREGQPGVQPERIGPYCSTFNPGYDPTLPLYREWPMFDAIKAANAGAKSAWSKWAEMPTKISATEPEETKKYTAVAFFGKDDSPVKRLFEEQQVVLLASASLSKIKAKKTDKFLLAIDGKYTLSAAEQAVVGEYMRQGADVWIWSPALETVDSYRSFLPAPLILTERRASSFIPEQRSWLKHTVNSDFYFCEIQTRDASQYAITGEIADEGEVLLRACRTDWRRWNKRPEELKTAAVLRSENEAPRADAVFVRYPTGASDVYISTPDNFTSTEKGFRTLQKILLTAGVAISGSGDAPEALLDDEGYILTDKLLVNIVDNRRQYTLWLYSPRPLDDLLIEPDMPKLTLASDGPRVDIRLNNRRLDAQKEIPLKQGWNRLELVTPNAPAAKALRFVSDNRPEFVKQLQTARYRN